ncbi:hypothetical protein A0J61_06923, partial [Choanephora cucurbitarum]
AAASTAAILKGATFQEVKTHGNWSQNSSTVEDYYFRPPNQHEAGRIMTERIFQSTENQTTSEVGVSHTAIVVGTTHNGQVGETKTEDVVTTRPWTMPWHWFSRPKKVIEKLQT